MSATCRSHRLSLRRCLAACWLRVLVRASSSSTAWQTVQFLQHGVRTLDRYLDGDFNEVVYSSLFALLHDLS
jgi:hypothetical protein